jgi:hypothetical protein
MGTPSTNTSTGRPAVLQSFADLAEIAETDNDAGFCIACGELAEGIEPDAHRYTCECCGAREVYGAEQLIMLGLHKG